LCGRSGAAISYRLSALSKIKIEINLELRRRTARRLRTPAEALRAKRLVRGVKVKSKRLEMCNPEAGLHATSMEALRASIQLKIKHKVKRAMPLRGNLTHLRTARRWGTHRAIVSRQLVVARKIKIRTRASVTS
jgi:hypothetical protein